MREKSVYYKRFPRDEQKLNELVGILAALSPAARRDLEMLGKDEVSSLRNGRYVGLEADGSPSELELLQAGLAEQFERRSSSGTDKIVRLTDAGRQVTRLLTANGEVPAVVSAALRTGEAEPGAQREE